MWRTTLLIALCLSACHHSTAPSSEAPAPTPETARTGESTLTPGTDAGAAARTPPANPEPLAADPGEAEARCTRDADCTLTQLSEEGCCPMLCTPRAIATTALARRQKSCANVLESSCPELPMCRPPRGAPSAVCQEGRCTVRFIPME